MIVLENNNGNFNFRVAGLIFSENREFILLQKSKNDKFWIIPGGRAEILEDSQETIKREILEELGVHIRKCKLVLVSENFYTYGENKIHEICFYYEINIKEMSEIENKIRFYGIENNKKLLFEWKKIDSIECVNLKPKILKNIIKNNYKNIEHIISKNYF